MYVSYADPVAIQTQTLSFILSKSAPLPWDIEESGHRRQHTKTSQARPQLKQRICRARKPTSLEKNLWGFVSSKNQQA